MTKRIVFIVGSMIRGGSERVVSILANYLAAKGHHVDIIMLLENSVKYDLDQNISVLPVCADESISRIKRIPGWLRAIRNYCITSRPDIIISFSARINILTIISNLGLKKRLIISERNDPKNDNRGVLGKILTKLLYSRATTIVFQTRRVKSYFSRRIQSKSCVLPNPISVETYAGDFPSKKIVNIGKLLPQKNHEMLINAFSRVHAKFPEYVLHIFGEGPLDQQLEKQIQTMGLSNSVLLRGNLPHIHLEIADAAMFVLSSDYEGLSNALLEAMMMGLPCISTDCAGSDEVIVDGVNGLLVPVGDADRMAEAMEKLMCNENLRKSIAQNAKKSAEPFRKEYVLDMWERVIDGKI